MTDERKQIVELTRLLEEANKAKDILFENLTEIMSCPYVLDRATVPKLGPESNPDQVVGNMCVSGRIYSNAREALKLYTREEENNYIY
jgi:hypothetical protein